MFRSLNTLCSLFIYKSLRLLEILYTDDTNKVSYYSYATISNSFIYIYILRLLY